MFTIVKMKTEKRRHDLSNVNDYGLLRLENINEFEKK